MARYVAKPPHGSRFNRSDPVGVKCLRAYLVAEGSGATLYDSADGKRGNGTLTSGFTWASTPYGKGLTLSSPNGSIPDYAFGTGAYTAAILFKPTGLSSFQNLLRSDAGGGGVGNWWIVRTNGTSLDFYPASSGGWITGVGTIVNNSWYLVVAVRSQGGASSLYLNGLSIGTATGATGNAGGSGNLTYIGSLSASSEFFAGQVAGAWLWTTALTAKQIRDWSADPFRPWRPRRLPVPIHAAAATTNRRRRVLIIGSR